MAKANSKDWITSNKYDATKLKKQKCFESINFKGRTKTHFTKYIYVCLGSKIPLICVYIAKIPQKNIHMFR